MGVGDSAQSFSSFFEEEVGNSAQSAPALLVKRMEDWIDPGNIAQRPTQEPRYRRKGQGWHPMLYPGVKDVNNVAQTALPGMLVFNVINVNHVNIQAALDGVSNSSDVNDVERC